MGLDVRQVGGAIIGAVVGFVAGGFNPAGAVKGAYVGYSLGSLAVPKPELGELEAPRLQDKTIQSSEYGSFLPRIYGTDTIAGNLFWVRDNELQIEPYSEWVKVDEGGGDTTSQKVNRERYRATFAVGMGEGPISGIKRIWFDEVLVFDRSDYTGFASNFIGLENGGKVEFFTGTETQLPWQEIVNELGDNAPAYRGTAYCGFSNIDVSKYGDRIPSVRFELVNGLEFGDNGQNAGEGDGGVNKVVDDAANAVKNANVIPTIYPAAPLDKGLPWYVEDGSSAFLAWDKTGTTIAATFNDRQGGTADIVGMPYIYKYFRPFSELNSSGDSAFYFGVERLDIFPWDLTGGLSGNNYGNLSILPIADSPSLLLTMHQAEDSIWYYSIGATLGSGTVRFFRLQIPANLTIAQFQDISVSYAAGYVYMFHRTLPVFANQTMTIYQVDCRDLEYSLPEGYVSNTLDVSTHFNYILPAKAVPLDLSGRTILITWGVARNGRVYILDLDNDLLHGYTVDLRIINDFIFQPAYWPQDTTQSATALGYQDAFAGDFAKTQPISERMYITDSFGGTSTFDALTNRVDCYFTQESSGDSNAYLRLITKSTNNLGFFFDVFGTGFNKPDYDLGEAFTDKWNWKHLVALPGSTFMYAPAPDTNEGGILDVNSRDAVFGDTTGTGLTALVETIALDKLIEKELLSTGLYSASDIDTTGLTPAQVKGFSITRLGAIGAGLKVLQQVYLFDVVEEDYKLKFKTRGTQSPSLTITPEFLRAHEIGQSAPPEVTFSAGNPNLTPGRVELLYKAIERDGEQGYAYADRNITTRAPVTQLESTVNMTATEAQNVTEILLADSVREQRGAYQFTLPFIYSHLERADVITLASTDYEVDVRIVDIEKGRPGLVKISAVEEEITDYVGNAVGSISAGNGGQLLNIPASGLFLLDLPPLKATHNDAGIYWGLYPLATDTDWRGGTLHQSSDNGASWSVIGNTRSGVTYGDASTTLVDDHATIYTYGQTLDVTIQNGTLATATLDSVKRGANLACYGAPGRWEILKFITATDNGDGTYTLSGFLRGQYGTEHNMNNHQIGDKFILLNQAVIDNRIPMFYEDGYTINYLYLPQSTGRPVNKRWKQGYASLAESSTPRSPTHLQGYRQSNGDWVIEWLPRSRYGFEWLNSVGQTITDSEEYQLKLHSPDPVPTTVDTLSNYSKDAFELDVLDTFDHSQNCWWKPDGTRFYCHSSSGSSILVFQGNGTFDTNNLTNETKVAGVNSGPFGIVQSPDGKYIFSIHITSANLQRTELTTAWEPGDGYEAGVQSFTTSFTNGRGLAAHSDGKRWVALINPDTLLYLTSPNAWDLTGITEVKTIDISVVTGQSVTGRGLFINDEGDVLITSGGTLHRFSMTGWDIDTLTYDSETIVIGGSAGGSAFVSRGGTRIHVGNTTFDDIYQYDNGGSYIAPGTLLATYEVAARTRTVTNAELTALFGSSPTSLDVSVAQRGLITSGGVKVPLSKHTDIITLPVKGGA